MNKYHFVYVAHGVKALEYSLMEEVKIFIERNINCFGAYSVDHSLYQMSRKKPE